MYSQHVQEKSQFNVLLDALRSLMDERKRREYIQILDVSSLCNDKVASSIVDRITDVSTDIQQGAPMLFLYFSLWATAVDDFVSRCGDRIFKVQITLENARKIWNARPIIAQNSPCWTKCQMVIRSLSVDELDDLIRDAEDVEKEARAVISKASKLHESDWTNSILSIYDSFKDIQENMTSRRKNNGQLTLTLCPELVTELDLKNRFVCWMVCVS
jgi:hypothetical protein